MVPLAKAIAGDVKLKDRKAVLRDDAFTLLERIKDKSSLEALLGFLSDKDDRVRYRAVEGIIAGFGADGLTKLLEGLPPGYTYKKEDVEDFIEKDIIAIGPRALEPMRAMLGSQNPVARLVAARVLGRVGTKEDIPALRKLAADKTRIKGWPKGATVGSEARAAVPILLHRDRILWVGGLRIDERFKVMPDTRNILRITISPMDYDNGTAA